MMSVESRGCVMENHKTVDVTAVVWKVRVKPLKV